MGNEKPEPWKFEIKEEGQKGLVGVYERMLRRYKGLVYALTLLPIYLLGALILAGALAPALCVFEVFSGRAELLAGASKWIWKGFGLGSSFFVYGFTLILLVPFINLFVRPFVKPARGQSYSTRFIGWYIHNALTYLVRYTFLEFITPTPFNLFFYRRMGMKIGKDVHINSSNISDPLMITIEDRVTVGGSVVIIAHYAMGGYLIVSPVVIRKGATLGLHAKILGGVEIGEGARILPGSVVMPKTVVPAGETWGGIPARKME